MPMLIEIKNINKNIDEKYIEFILLKNDLKSLKDIVDTLHKG